MPVWKSVIRQKSEHRERRIGYEDGRGWPFCAAGSLFQTGGIAILTLDAQRERKGGLVSLGEGVRGLRGGLLPL